MFLPWDDKGFVNSIQKIGKIVKQFHTKIVVTILTRSLDYTAYIVASESLPLLMREYDFFTNLLQFMLISVLFLSEILQESDETLRLTMYTQVGIQISEQYIAQSYDLEALHCQQRQSEWVITCGDRPSCRSSFFFVIITITIIKRDTCDDDDPYTSVLPSVEGRGLKVVSPATVYTRYYSDECDVSLNSFIRLQRRPTRLVRYNKNSYS